MPVKRSLSDSKLLILSGLDPFFSSLLRFQANLRLRTKFLLSLVVIVTALGGATLLVVRHSALLEVQRHVKEDTQNAILTFQAVQHQREMTLKRKADLLATLAMMRNGDATTIDTASEDPWRSDDVNLYVVADASGKVTAFHSSATALQISAVQELLNRSLRKRDTSGWWDCGNHLYQVVLEPFREGGTSQSRLLGTVVVGREMDIPGAKDLKRITSSEIAFRHGRQISVSTFSPLDEQELAQQLRDRAVLDEIEIGNERFAASSLDLMPMDQLGLSLVVLKSYDNALSFLHRLNRMLVGLGLLAVVVGGALAFLISDAFTRPLTALVGGVHALEEGNFTYPLHAQGEDEVAQVTRAFEKMRHTLRRNEEQKKQLEDDLRQSQKMEALGRLAGGVAHDFNNLLTVIKGHTDIILGQLKPNDASHHNSEQVRKAADRAASLTRQLLAFSRRQVLQSKVLDLNALIAEMGTLLKRLVREDIEFVLQLGVSLGRMKGDPGQIEQVLLNLTVNACDAMPAGGKLVIQTKNIEVDADYARTHPSLVPGQYVSLTVADTGQGMDATTKARIFEPFFTTKSEGKGTGLGLATVYGVVKQSCGCILVDTAPGKGARFEIYWPQVSEPLDPAVTERIGTPTHNASETVLLVEDDPEVRELAEKLLSSAGYQVLSACDGARALEIAASPNQTIHLLITDVVMPRLRGPELARRLQRLHPSLKTIFMTGYLEDGEGHAGPPKDAFILDKPFSRDKLLSIASHALLGLEFIQANQQSTSSQTLSALGINRTPE